MHELEPFYRWLTYYDPSTDPNSPFEGKEYNYDVYSETVYGYYLAPGWDYMGSETLYMKILYADYDEGYVVFEFIGEWNDALHNDIMHLKRNIVEHFDEMKNFNIDSYVNFGGTLQIDNWRTLTPKVFYQLVEQQIQRRIG